MHTQRTQKNGSPHTRDASGSNEAFARPISCIRASAPQLGRSHWARARCSVGVGACVLTAGGYVLAATAATAAATAASPNAMPPTNFAFCVCVCLFACAWALATRRRGTEWRIIICLTQKRQRNRPGPCEKVNLIGAAASTAAVKRTG